MDFRHTSRSPSAPLRRSVHDFWSLSLPAGAVHATDHLVMPDRFADLIFRLTAPIESDRPARFEIRVNGNPTAAAHSHAPSVARIVAVRFQPGGAFPFFGLPMSELANRTASLEDLWGTEAARRLGEQLAMAPTLESAATALEESLIERAMQVDFDASAHRRLTRAIARLTESDDGLTVNALAEELGVSARQLRRQFDEQLGVGPKAFSRVLRFQKALALAQSTPAPDWSAIAQTAGYYDQPHLISEFRALTSHSPTELLALPRR